MLPGIRILFAIVVLSVSVLVFGLGAAAFLRAAHENLSSTPAYRPIETAYAPRVEMPRAETLSMLRVQTPAEIGATELRSDQPVSLTVSPRDDRGLTDATPPAVAAPAAEPATPAAESPKIEEPTTVSTLPPAAPAEPVELPAAAGPMPAPIPDMPVAGAPETVPAPVLSEAAPIRTGDAAGQDSLTAADRADAHATGPLALLQPHTTAAIEAPRSDRAPQPVAPEATTAAPAEAAPKPEQTAALAEPAIPAQPPLPISAVRIPKPRIDPKVIETQQKEERARQQRAERAQAEARARARRVAAASRARAAAAAQARTADPFAPTPFQQPAATR